MTSFPAQFDPTNRFTNRVDNYVKYRPTYPIPAVRFVKEYFGLGDGSLVADIGSGTGIFSSLLLDAGIRVTAVEPNAAMRMAAEKSLGNNPLFTSIDAKAEATGLSECSVDLITVAQAFHWMDQAETKKEFARILRRDGHIALIWNLRRTDSDFLAALDKIKRQYGQAHNNGQRANEDEIRAFFAPKKMMVEQFLLEESHDFSSLKGQLLSSSFLPLAGSPGFDEMTALLQTVFDQFQQNGRVIVSYETKIYYPG